MFSLGVINRMNIPPPTYKVVEGKPKPVRVRQVFTSREDVMRCFFKQEQTHARTPRGKLRDGGMASRVFFENNTLFSYGHHYPLCCLRIAPCGERVAFVNLHHYSQMTEAHRREVKNVALRLKWTVVETRTPTAGMGAIVLSLQGEAEAGARLTLGQRIASVDTFDEAKKYLASAAKVAELFELVFTNEFNAHVTLVALMAKAEHHAAHQAKVALNDTMIGYRKSKFKPLWRQRRLAEQCLELFPERKDVTELAHDVLTV